MGLLCGRLGLSLDLSQLHEPLRRGNHGNIPGENARQIHKGSLDLVDQLDHRRQRAEAHLPPEHPSGAPAQRQKARAVKHHADAGIGKQRDILPPALEPVAVIQQHIRAVLHFLGHVHGLDHQQLLHGLLQKAGNLAVIFADPLVQLLQAPPHQASGQNRRNAHQDHHPGKPGIQSAQDHHSRSQLRNHRSRAGKDRQNSVIDLSYIGIQPVQQLPTVVG